jgi:hypothetical protein
MRNEEYIIKSLKNALPEQIFLALMRIRNNHNLGDLHRSDGIQDVLFNADPHTFAHVKRVARGAVQMAQLLDCPKALLPAIYRLGFHHDDGKMTIIDTVTKNPLRLTDQQRAVLLPPHTLYGLQIAHIMKMSLAQKVVNVSHHIETKGYPTLSQIIDTRCFTERQLEILSGFFFEKNNPDRNHIICNPSGVIIYNGLIISPNDEDYELYFGLYASQLVTVVDGPDAMFVPRPYQLAGLSENDVIDSIATRRQIAWSDLECSGLPAPVLSVANIWMREAEVSLKEKAMDRFAVAA